MKCQICGQRPATTHITRRVNDQVTEWHVCAECALKQGFGVSHGLSMDSLFGGMFTQPFLREADQPATACPVCGMTYRDIVQGGQIGCPTCYITFYDRLQPSIQRIHGKTSHVGKIAAAGSEHARKQQQIDTLKAELNAAVAAQEYERCAELRDRIKQMEEENT